MTIVPPGLIAPPDQPGTVVVVERHPAPSATRPVPEPRWSVRSVAFVLLVAFTFVVLGITLQDLTNG